MKLFLSLFIMFITVSSFAFAGERYIYDKGGKIKFSLITPDGWEVNSKKENGVILSLTGPTEKSFTVKINIMVDKIKNITLDEYIKTIHSTFKNPPPIYKEIKILSEHTITVNRIQRYEAVIDYILNMNGKNLGSRTMETIIIKDGVAFIIIGSAMESNFSKYEGIFKGVSDSFKFE
ncbi:MAG: hypothetical protein ABRQ38_15890 [Candidatus Eremiobacterota bacterium]